MRLGVALLTIGLLTLAHPARAQDAVSDQARQLFSTGVSLLEDPAGPRYEEAYRAFRAAYRDSPSPKILGNLGLCAMMLERDGEAIAAYERYLAEVTDIGADERAHIERELGVLSGSAVPLTLTVAPADATIIDTRTPVRGSAVINRYEAPNGELKTRIRTGQHRIEVRREGYQAQTWAVDAAPGEPLVKRIALQPIPAPQPPPAVVPDTAPADEGGTSVFAQPLVITGLAVSGAGFVATAIVGGLAGANHSDYEEAREAGDVSRGAELLDKGETLNLIGDALLVGSIVATAATVTMILAWPDDEPGAASSSNVSVAVGPTGARLGVTW